MAYEYLSEYICVCILHWMNWQVNITHTVKNVCWHIQMQIYWEKLCDTSSTWPWNSTVRVKANWITMLYCKYWWFGFLYATVWSHNMCFFCLHVCIRYRVLFDFCWTLSSIERIICLFVFSHQLMKRRERNQAIT